MHCKDLLEDPTRNLQPTWNLHGLHANSKKGFDQDLGKDLLILLTTCTGSCICEDFTRISRGSSQYFLGHVSGILTRLDAPSKLIVFPEICVQS